MKKSSFEQILILSFGIMYLFLDSCIKPGRENCPEPKTYIDTLTAIEKAKIPYKGFETLTFVRTSVGDTHTFIGTGIQQGYLVETLTASECIDYAHLERLNYKFVSTTFPDPIYLSIYIKSYNDIPYIEINFRSQLFLNALSEVTLTSPLNFQKRQILDSTYYNISKIADFNAPMDTVFYSAYSLKYGILQLKFKNGELWELLSKK